MIFFSLDNNDAYNPFVGDFSSNHCIVLASLTLQLKKADLDFLSLIENNFYHSPQSIFLMIIY